MQIRFTIAATVLILALCGHVSAQSRTEIALEKERTKLALASDPVDRTRTDIRISDLLITLVTDAARDGDEKLAEQHLNDYAGTIQDAHLTMLKTGRDAHKHPAGFKDLEIALRKQQRRLADASKLLDYDKRATIEKVRNMAGDIGDQLVKLMLLKDPNAARKP